MYKIGDFVINTSNGICEIKDIVSMDISGEKKDYYLLVPVEENTAKVYIPTDNAAHRLRHIMSETEVWNLIHSITDIPEVYIENDKEREKVYKEALASHDPKQLIGIIKTLYLRREKRLNEGKKNTAVDERYFKIAENHLHAEIAFVLKVEKIEVRQLIVEHIAV